MTHDTDSSTLSIFLAIIHLLCSKITLKSRYQLIDRMATALLEYLNVFHCFNTCFVGFLKL